MLKNHKPFPFVLLLLFGLCYCHATTVVFVVTSSGIFVGADSKVLERGGVRMGCPITQNPDKASVVQDRLIVATLATASIDLHSRRTGESICYDFTEWIANVKKKCPKDVTVTALTGIVKSESSIAFKNIDKPLAAGAFGTIKQASNPLIGYFVAGYENGVPVINGVEYHVDWHTVHLNPAIVVLEHVNHQEGIDKNLHVFGWNDFVYVVKSGKGESYKEIAAVLPNELPKLIAGKDLTLNEATNVCLAVLRWEHKYHEGFVAPPYIIWTIPPFGMGSVIRMSHEK